MSQYPPPPPSYGAYDQPPPPGFGYPPGNQGPYYPQPGYPQPPYQPGVNPTTCPPGPGGYYPGQPATQTIEIRETLDFSSMEKEQLVQQGMGSSSESENYKHVSIAPLDNENNKSAAVFAECYQNLSSKKCNGESKPTTPVSGDVNRNPFVSETVERKYGLSTPECDDVSLKSFVPEVHGERYKQSAPVCGDIGQIPTAMEVSDENYKQLAPETIDVSVKSTDSEFQHDDCTQNVSKLKQSPLGRVDEKDGPLVPEKNHEEIKPSAPELDHDDLKITSRVGNGEECKPILLEEDFENIKPSAPEMDCDDRYLVPSEKERSSENFNEKQSTSPNVNDQRLNEKALAKSNEMERLAVVGRQDMNYRPQNNSGNNVQLSNFTSSSYPIIVTQPVPYNRFGESDRTECCNDDCCAGDCGGDKCCKDDCCAGDCGGDKCCKDDCCGDDCCKDCCNDDCCKDCCNDDCCTDEQACELFCECLCLCIFAAIESCGEKS